jgi:hypothetical protein
MLIVAALPLEAQTTIRSPRPSQKQVVTQTVGVTDIAITFSRPGVKGRTIWGGLVPYGQVWRAGANEATTIAFSDDVKINGNALPKGTYSLHTIPGKDEWTIIFNKVADQWGSYSYDAKQDALRITAKPKTAEFREWLSYDFDQLSADQATVAIRWENLSVPFTVNTDAVNKTLASVRSTLAAGKADDWRTRYIGAQVAFDNNVATDEATKWINEAVAAKANISTLWLQARIQQKAGNAAAAKKTAAAAIAAATKDDDAFVSEIKKQSAAW